MRTERGNRVFPDSDKSSDVIKTLERAMQRYGVVVSLNQEIKSVKKDKQFHILCDNSISYTCDSLIVATGGVSYAGTGASGLGYSIAKHFGHKFFEPRSALCPVVVKEDVSELNGLSLRNVTLSYKNGKKSFEEFGDLLFTFNSLTGPIALTLSSKINKLDIYDKSLHRKL